MNRVIHLLGLNHRTAGVDVRERYALSERREMAAELIQNTPALEALALSTCNRVELLFTAPDNSGARQAVVQYWAESCCGSVKELSPHLYHHAGMDAVSHVFTVASSLDSMVMGEPQILGQLKDAYREAVANKATGPIINRLLHRAFFTAKRVRTETGVAESAVSISYAAVELAKHIFGDLSGRTAMLVGAGEMAELAAAHLLSSGVTNVLIANRTFERAQELARQFRGDPVAFDDLFTRLHEADIVVSSTGATSLVIRSKDVKNVLRKRRFRPMFFIDIAVPRDIDPDVNNLDNAYLYDIDDLEEVVEENKAQRQDEASKAKAIVAAETCAFSDWLTSLALNPTIKRLVDMAEQTGFREMEKTLKRLGDDSPETRQALETLVRSVALKILHEPISFLKRRTQEEGSAERFIDLVRRIFNMDDPEPPADAHADRRRGSPPPHIDCPLGHADEDD